MFQFGEEGFNPDVAMLTFSAYAPSPGRTTVKTVLNLVENKRIEGLLLKGKLYYFQIIGFGLVSGENFPLYRVGCKEQLSGGTPHFVTGLVLFTNHSSPLLSRSGRNALAIPLKLDKAV